MSIPSQWLERKKTLMIAMILIAQKIAAWLDVDLQAPLARLCDAVGANRTSVYEQVERILTEIDRLADARPGRPTRPAGEPAHPSANLELTLAVLEFQVKHPGSASPGRRTRYAPIFQRFILELRDRWQGTDQDFAQATRLPLDTLRDWLRKDRQGLLPKPCVKAPLTIPRDASALTRDIAEAWQSWVGSTREFLCQMAPILKISPDRILRVLRILGAVSARRRKPCRYRNSTEKLSPGAVLITDGKRLFVQLSSGRTTALNWQAMVDQTTGCHTAIVVNREENAQGVLLAYENSRTMLGDAVPQGLVHDNKPCYENQRLQERIKEAGTSMIPATAKRPENKALLEGAFGLFEQRVGTLELDDTSKETLIRSAVCCVLRAYTAATDSVARVELDGKSRLRVLREACPGPEEKKKDRDFLRKLKARHQRNRQRAPNSDPLTRKLLDEVFAQLGLLDKDPKGQLRRYLASYFEPEAIRRAAALVASKLASSRLERRYAHRYLAKVIANQQDELDLYRAAEELLHLCRCQNEDWTRQEQLDYQILLDDSPSSEQLAQAVAERAAYGGIPLQATFWTQKLLELLKAAQHLIDTIKKVLIRLSDAPFQNRLALLDQITALECRLA